MLEAIDAPAHLLALRLTGEVTAEDIERYRALVDDRLAAQPWVSLLIDLTGLDEVDLGAIGAGLAADVDFFRHLDRYHRCAIVAEQGWVRFATRVAATVVPRVELRVFDGDGGEEARAWAEESPALPADGAIRRIATTEDAVVAFAIDGVIEKETVDAMAKQLVPFFATHPSSRLLVRIVSLDGVEPRGLLSTEVLSMKLEALRSVERYAVVGAPGWMRKLIEAIAPLFEELEVRAFDREDEASAWAWVGAQPAK